MRDSAKTIVPVLCVILLAGLFWFLLLAPKRDKANELSEQAGAISAEVAASQSQLAAATAAKHNFAGEYARLVELGKAVPPEADTPSLLTQLQGISRRADSSFVSIGVGSSSGSGEVAATTSTAGQLPLGASVGAAGLPAMAYSLEFTGGFFEIAKFIHELDALVTTDNEEVEATGRLVTIDSFSLVPEKGENNVGKKLNATFQVTTYVAPTSEGLTAGATAVGPEVAEAATTETETAE